MKIETGRLAGQLGWYVFVDGMLDCDIPASQTEQSAEYAARLVYPQERIVTTNDAEHYSRESIK